MAAPKSIIAPGQHVPKGLIPRNLMVGGFLLISGVAILWFLAQGSSAPPPDPQARVKAQLQESAATAERGNPAMVDQAAKQAPANVQAAAAKAAAEAASAASAASASSVPRPVAATSGPIEPGYERGLPAPEGGGQRPPPTYCLATRTVWPDVNCRTGCRRARDGVSRGPSHRF